MADLVLDRADLWPVGTSVAAYDRIARGAAVETETVGSDGRVTFTGLTDGKAYSLVGVVGGVSKRLHAIKASAFVPRSPWPWKAVHDARVAAAPARVQGIVSLVAGAATVSLSSIAAGSTVLLHRMNGGLINPELTPTKTNGVGFAIASSSATDVGVIGWEVVA